MKNKKYLSDWSTRCSGWVHLIKQMHEQLSNAHHIKVKDFFTNAVAWHTKKRPKKKYNSIRSRLSVKPSNKCVPMVLENRKTVATFGFRHVRVPSIFYWTPSWNIAERMCPFFVWNWCFPTWQIYVMINFMVIAYLNQLLFSATDSY